MRKTTKSLLAAACATMAFAAVGCGTTTENRDQGVQQQNPIKNCKGPNGKYTIGMSQANVAEPYRELMNDDIRKAVGKNPQFSVEFADAAQDNAKQVADVENFITKQVDL